MNEAEKNPCKPCQEGVKVLTPGQRQAQEGRLRREKYVEEANRKSKAAQETKTIEKKEDPAQTILRRQRLLKNIAANNKT